MPEFDFRKLHTKIVADVTPGVANPYPIQEPPYARTATCDSHYRLTAQPTPIHMVINDPATLAELETAFDAYERALTGNDVAELDRLFWDNTLTLRYGAGETLYGIEAIREFRNARPAKALARDIVERSVTTFGTDFAVANIAFRRAGEPRLGRQSQSWVRLPEGWQVVAAHVSWQD